MDFAYIGMVVLLVLGFGFVIFWHELGHFVAAKWAGVKVEQFAVGFGQAIVSWRKGLGWRRGSSAREYEEILRADREGLNKIDPASLGETEYRLNWIPLGGYVKMLGQDDLRPGAVVDDPRAYNNKPIGKRMVIVSAGVIMNVILAAVLFMVLFLIGFNAPPAVVGAVQTGSPAQEAGLEVGDRILYFDGRLQHDFTKISLNVALVQEGEAVPMTVQRPDGTEKTLTITARRPDPDPTGFLQLGIVPAPALKGIDAKRLPEEVKAKLADEPVRPGETVVEVAGKPVGVGDYYALDRAVQGGQPVPIVVKDEKGQLHRRTVQPKLIEPFGKTPLNFAGLEPRTTVGELAENSSAREKLKTGDIIVDVTMQPAIDQVPNPTPQKLMELLNSAGKNDAKVDMTVLRNGQKITVKGLDPTVKVDKNRKGLGIFLLPDEMHPVVAETLPGSAAARADIPAGATITGIDGQAVSNWHDVLRLLKAATAGKPMEVAAKTAEGEKRTFALELTPEQLAQIRENHYRPDVTLAERKEPRKTGNPLVAAGWGIGETRDLMVQFYLTLRRMIQGSVSPSNAMGPIGIFHQGSIIANRGIDWLIWFLAMISANLAVVNFLPIPIVDGGLFVFLIVEKIMGKPLSPRAQSIAQIVGLALIISVFLFVTYHDINRFL